MVHAKMYSTIHKSALSQQSNKTFPPRTVKASPFIFTWETKECKDVRQRRGKGKHEGEAAARGVSGEGRADAGRVTVGKGGSQALENRV